MGAPSKSWENANTESVPTITNQPTKPVRLKGNNNISNQMQNAWNNGCRSRI